MTPNQAKDGKNNVEVWLNINEKATFMSKYPPIKKGDTVRVYIKKKTGFSKGYEPRFSKEVYKVMQISEDGKRYLINNNTRRLYSRHELRKIEIAETKDG